MSRRKNPHPKRAENVKTVVVVSAAEEREEEEERPVLLCLRIPDEEDYDDVDFEIEQMRYVKKRLRRREEGRERERNNTSAMFARRCLDVRKIWPDTCAFTRTRDRTNVMCARSVFVNLVL